MQEQSHGGQALQQGKKFGVPVVTQQVKDLTLSLWPAWVQSLARCSGLRIQHGFTSDVIPDPGTSISLSMAKTKQKNPKTKTTPPNPDTRLQEGYAGTKVNPQRHYILAEL